MFRDVLVRMFRSTVILPEGIQEQFPLRRREPGARLALPLPILPGPIRRVPTLSLPRYLLPLAESLYAFSGWRAIFSASPFSLSSMAGLCFWLGNFAGVFNLLGPERRGVRLGPSWGGLGEGGCRLGEWRGSLGGCGGCPRAGVGRPRGRSRGSRVALGCSRGAPRALAGKLRGRAPWGLRGRLAGLCWARLCVRAPAPCGNLMQWPQGAWSRLSVLAS